MSAQEDSVSHEDMTWLERFALAVWAEAHYQRVRKVMSRMPEPGYTRATHISICGEIQLRRPQDGSTP